MSVTKKTARLRRATRTRSKIRTLSVHRLSVHRTPRHIYAQIFAPGTYEVVAAASTVDKELRKGMKNGGNINAAIEVGKLVARRAKAKGVKRVAFDRSGFNYHGRIKALADAAREGGLEF
ncbi:MAG TPA: 50S ribosomal protein L18 [Gammaproteobacteria bacterium]|nr:50S ribosomal protein L18 [Gammaproteobacteria bacterium]